MINREVVTIVPTLPVGFATGILTSDNTNPAVGDTVTINGKVYTFNSGVTGTAASGVLTSNNTNVSDGDTVTIGSQVYTFKTALTSGNANPGEVLISAVNADGSLTNLKNAINGTGTPGTDYDSSTPVNTNVTSSAVSSHALTLTAVAVGASYNSVVTTTTATTLSWGAVTLTGGINIINSILIGASADATLTNLVAAINGAAGAGTTYGTGTVANTDVIAGAVSSHTITVIAFTSGIAGNAITTTKSSSHLTWGDTTLIGGEGGALTGQTLDGAQAYTTNAIDVSSYTELLGFLNIISHSGTNPTLDCKMQLSPDSKNWVDSGDTFTQLTTSNVVGFKRFTSNFGKYVRFVLTLGGTDPHYNLDMKVLGKL